MDDHGRPVQELTIDAERPIEVTIALSNTFQVPREILITVFVDGMQQESDINGQRGVVHMLPIAPSVAIHGRLVIRDLAPGFHSVVVLVVLDPNSPVEGLAVLDTWGTHRIARRLEVTVGHACSDTTEMPETPTTPVSPTYPDMHGALLSEKADEPVGWLGGSWHLGTKRFFIHLGNQTNRTEDYLVTLLVDWRQVALDPANGVMVGYVSLEPEEIRSFAASVRLPHSFHRHPVVALAFNQPYSSLLGIPVVGVVEDSHRVYLWSMLPWLLAGTVLVGLPAAVLVVTRRRSRCLSRD